LESDQKDPIVPEKLIYIVYFYRAEIIKMRKLILRLFHLIRKGEIAFLIKGVSKRLYSKTEAFGLKRDLSIPFTTPNAQIAISIRPFKLEDASYFEADLQNDGLIEKAISTCYVAVTDKDEPCCRLWLIDSSESEKIRAFWGDAFPNLNSDEALIESVFTVPNMRGQGIMPETLELVSRKATENHKKYVMLFVQLDNIPSLKASHRAGFTPYILRTEIWKFFKRQITFESLEAHKLLTYQNLFDA
jgi:GNAT superfamily N-acetyltransferase